MQGHQGGWGAARDRVALWLALTWVPSSVRGACGWLHRADGCGGSRRVAEECTPVRTTRVHGGRRTRVTSTRPLEDPSSGRVVRSTLTPPLARPSRRAGMAAVAASPRAAAPLRAHSRARQTSSVRTAGTVTRSAMRIRHRRTGVAIRSAAHHRTPAQATSGCEPKRSRRHECRHQRASHPHIQTHAAATLMHAHARCVPS